MEAAGRSMFGGESLMYGYWFDAAAQANRNMILFGLKRDQISDAGLAAKFSTLGPVEEQILKRGTEDIGRFYYRVGYNYIVN